MLKNVKLVVQTSLIVFRTLFTLEVFFYGLIMLKKNSISGFSFKINKTYFELIYCIIKCMYKVSLFLKMEVKKMFYKNIS